MQHWAPIDIVRMQRFYYFALYIFLDFESCPLPGGGGNYKTKKSAIPNKQLVCVSTSRQLHRYKHAYV